MLDTLGNRTELIRSRPAANLSFDSAERETQFMAGHQQQNVFVVSCRKTSKQLRRWRSPSLASPMPMAARQSAHYRWATTWSRPFLEADGHPPVASRCVAFLPRFSDAFLRRVKIEQEWKSQYKQVAKASLLFEDQTEERLLRARVAPGDDPRLLGTMDVASVQRQTPTCASFDVSTETRCASFTFFPQNRHNEFCHA